MTTRSRTFSLAWRWAPLLLWMGFIFLISSRSQAPQLQNHLADLLLKKGLHMVEYAILALLAWRAIGGGQRVSPSSLGLAWLIAALYALTDEFHQTFVPNRHGRLSDAAIDSLGAALALVILHLWARRSRRR